MNLRTNFKFTAIFASFLCALFVFTAGAYANGDIYADEPGGVPPMGRAVQRAPIRRPPQRTPAAQPAQPQPQVQPEPQPPQPCPLETGIRLMEQMRFEQARRWLQKAVQEQPDNPYAWYWFGRAHVEVGLFNQAQFFYARALALDPGFAPFSRVVAYPNDDRIPLWDPVRPARVFPVELGSHGITIVPPDAPQATPRASMPHVDPSLPLVPVYVPPLFPADVHGYAIQPPVYVPPGFMETPVFIPPPPPR